MQDYQRKMIDPQSISVDMQKLSDDPEHFLIVRLGFAYNDLANVSHLFKFIKAQFETGGMSREIYLGATAYLQVQNVVHLAGAIEILPELWQRLEENSLLTDVLKSDPRISNHWANLQEYLKEDKKLGRREGTKAKIFEQQIQAFRHNLGAHYNSNVGGKVIKEGLDIFLKSGHSASNITLGNKELSSPIFVFTQDILLSAWQGRYMGIEALDSEPVSEEKRDAAQRLIINVKDDFCGFASTFIINYLKKINAVSAEVQVKS